MKSKYLWLLFGVMVLILGMNLFLPMSHAATNQPVPGQIEAESYSAMSGIQTESCSEGGQDVGWTDAGDWLDYSVNVQTAGSYTVGFRVASPYANTQLQLRNGAAVLATVTVPNTGGYQNWATVTVNNITLAAGNQTLRIYAVTNGWNINWINFSLGTTPPSGSVDFGPNVYIFDPSMPAADIQSRCDAVFAQQQSNQFGSERIALLFKPGSYHVNVGVGFYTSVIGLGQRPDDTTITGSIRCEADWMGGNATCNFWRTVENLADVPTYSASPVAPAGMETWAASQAAPMRRMHIKGALTLWDPNPNNYDGSWSSGGFIADSVIDGQISSGSQQQYFTRNSQMGSWSGSNWNMVFVGAQGAPGDTWPSPPYTSVGQTPVIREKPFLYIDSSGNYSVFVPALRTNSLGCSWSSGIGQGTSLPISQFYIAKSGTDTAATINAALSGGKNLILTPGIYHLSAPIQITRANTVVLGMGLPTLMPDNGTATMKVADVDGVTLAGILFDAGATNSPVLLEVGPAGSSQSHASNPTFLYDIFCRVGGAAAGKATQCMVINSNNVVGDDFWIWRADHGTGVGWATNTATNGLIVNGNNVTCYGLFVEHFQQYQTLWNGNGGRTYFYQSECPYDAPNQAAWQHNGVNGWASYKVADTVTSHEAWGLGVYCVYTVDLTIKCNSGLEAPVNSGVKLHHLVTVSLGGQGEITHVINNIGGPSNSAINIATVNQFP